MLQGDMTSDPAFVWQCLKVGVRAGTCIDWGLEVGICGISPTHAFSTFNGNSK